MNLKTMPRVKNGVPEFFGHGKNGLAAVIREVKRLLWDCKSVEMERIEKNFVKTRKKMLTNLVQSANISRLPDERQAGKVTAT